MADAASRVRAESDRRDTATRGVLHWFAWTLFAVGIVFAAVGWALGDTFYLRLAIEALIFAGLGIAVDLLLGYTGLLSLGQALFFGYGAYVSALVLKHIAPSFWAAMGIALGSGLVVGLIAGIIAIRARGVYFALITFGLAQVIAKVVYNTRALGASDGIIGVPVIKIEFGLFAIDTAHAPSFFLFVLVLMIGVYFLCAHLMDTPFGRTLAAIRANESRVPFLGLPAWRYKLLAFVLAAEVATLSGALYPMLRGFVSPELMYFQTSGNAVITVILGGVGTLIGPMLGSVLLTVLKSFIGTITEHQLIIIGALFMLSVVLMPKGIVGYLKPRLERRRLARMEAQR